ncbi:hypothetical protein Tco_0266989 [Tanacetum coccineum]
MVLEGLTGWKLRKRKWTDTTKRLIEDLESAYGFGFSENAPNMFYIRIRHGGTFRRYPGRTYVDGHVDIFDLVDIDLFTVVVLNMMVVQLGYKGESEPLYYNYLRPLTSLDEGLYALACEEDVRCLDTLVRSFKLIEVYIEHGVTAVDSYRRPPPQVRATIEDITEHGSSAAIEHRSEEMLSLPQHDSSTPHKDSVCESVTPRCMPHCMLTTPTDESVITYTQLSGSQQATASHIIEDVMRQLSFEKTELDGEAGFSDIAGSGLESYGLSHDESFGVDDLDVNLNEPVDLNVSQIETQSELPVFEEPDVCRTQKPIIEEVKTQEPIIEEMLNKVMAGNESAPSDGQFFYDVEGIDSAYETQYDVYMDVPFDNIGVTNLVPADVLEGDDVDVINPDGFDSDPGVINASGQWKYSFYTAQKFTTAKEAKDIVHLHSIESRKNLKLYKNDSVRVRARCDEKVHVFTMSQGTGPTGPN